MRLLSAPPRPLLIVAAVLAAVFGLIGLAAVGWFSYLMLSGDPLPLEIMERQLRGRP